MQNWQVAYFVNSIFDTLYPEVVDKWAFERDCCLFFCTQLSFTKGGKSKCCEITLKLIFALQQYQPMKGAKKIFQLR